MKQVLGMAAGAAFLMMPMTAFAASMTASDFASARLAAFGSGDFKALMEQYSDDAIVLTQQGTLTGKSQIGPMIEAALAEFGQAGTKFNLISTLAEGNVVTFVWSGETAKNTYHHVAETYVLQDGKARYETFAAQISPK